MHTTVRAGFLAAALLAAPPSIAQDQALISAGSRIYAENCAECHGERLVNTGAAFDLRLLKADERPRFNKSVMEGKGGQMPPWQGVLNEQHLDQLWAYIRSRTLAP